MSGTSLTPIITILARAITPASIVTETPAPTIAKIAVAAARLDERRAHAGCRVRKANLGQEFIGREIRREVPAEELLCRDAPLSARGARRDQLGIECKRHCWQLGGGIGMGNAPTDRPPGSDRHVPDQWEGVRDERQSIPDEAVALDGPRTGHGADGDTTIERGDPVKLVEC